MIWQGDTENESPNYAERAGFYGIFAVPYAKFGGTSNFTGGGEGNYEEYLELYNEQIDEESPLEIALSFYSNEQDEYIIQADVEVTAEIEQEDNQILFILTRRIDDDYFCSLVSYEEQPFTLGSIGDSGTFETTVFVDPDWNLEDLKAVVLVQSWENDPGPFRHEIHQAAMTEFSEESYVENKEIVNPFQIGNYPNPFHSQTTISFSVTQTSRFVTLEIYNIKGQKIITLDFINQVDAKATQSLYSKTWDGKDESGKSVDSGIYFYKIGNKDFSKIRKMVKIK